MLRQTLSNEIQSFRQGLATIADAVKAVRPLIDAEGEQRCESEGRLAETLERGLQELRAEVSELTPLKALKSELADLASMRVKPRLLAIEREMRELGDKRRRNAATPAQACSKVGSGAATRAASGVGGAGLGGGAGACTASAVPCGSYCCPSCGVGGGEGGYCSCSDEDEAWRAAHSSEATEETLRRACREIRDEAMEEALALKVKCSEDVEQQRLLLQATEGSFQRTLEAAHSLRSEARDELQAVRRLGAEDVEQHRKVLQAAQQGMQRTLQGLREEARAEAGNAASAGSEEKQQQRQFVQACEEAAAHAEAQAVANHEMQNQLAVKMAEADASRAAWESELTASRAASKRLSLAQARLGEAFQETEVTLASKVRAAVVTAEGAAAAELSTELHAGICRAHNSLKAELAVAEEAGIRAARTSTKGIQRLEARLAGFEERMAHAEEAQGVRLQQECVAASEDCGVRTASQLSSLAKAVKSLGAELASDRQESATRARRGEQVCASELATQASTIQGIAQEASVAAAAVERLQREEKELWTKVHELARNFRERLPVERRDALSAAERGLKESREELRRGLSASLEEQMRATREDINMQMEAQLRQVSATAHVWMEEHAEQWQQTQVAVRQSLLAVEAQAEKRAENCGQQYLEQLHVAQESVLATALDETCEEMSHKLAQSVEEVEGNTNMLRAELVAFMDEQRVFCGFLDTEQRAYQELARQEIRTLSRLVSGFVDAKED